jgi:hypothetical protein
MYVRFILVYSDEDNKKIETLFYILHLQIYVYKFEREIIMKIEVGPPELFPPLHPFSFFVFPLTVLTNPS